MVADGMGGHAAGEVASGTAVSVISEYIKRNMINPEDMNPDDTDPGIDPVVDLLEQSVLEANAAIVKLSENNPDMAGMGTTVSALLVRYDQACIAHVGDSRIYRLRSGAFDLLTTDHSWVNEQVLHNVITPEEARNHRWRNVITRALGNKLDLAVDSLVINLHPGDTYLICSDGLSGMVMDNTMHEVLTAHGDDLAGAAQELIDKANDAGGTDNITLILVHVQE